MVRGGSQGTRIIVLAIVAGVVLATDSHGVRDNAGIAASSLVSLVDVMPMMR